MAQIIEGFVDSRNERYSEVDAEDDVGLRNLEQNNRQLSLEISAVLKLLWEQYEGHDGFNVTQTFPSEISTTPGPRRGCGRRTKRFRARRKTETSAHPNANPVRADLEEEDPYEEEEGDLAEEDPVKGDLAVENPMPSTRPVYRPEIFQSFITMLAKLERIAVDDFLNENSFFDFLYRFLLKYARVFLVDPRNDPQWRVRVKLEVTDFVHSKSEEKLEHLFFLLRHDRVCDLLVFNVADASFYFYENQSRNDNVALARELVFFLRHLLQADQMVHASCAADVSSNTLFAAEMLMRILFNAVDSHLEGPMLSMTQVVNLPSFCDFLTVVIASQYLINEISEVEQLLMLIRFESPSLRDSSKRKS